MLPALVPSPPGICFVNRPGATCTFEHGGEISSRWRTLGAIFLQTGEDRLFHRLGHGKAPLAPCAGAETKTGASRKVPIHPRSRPILEALPKASTSWRFQASPSPRYPDGGHWINTKHLNEDFLKLLGKHGLPAGRDREGRGFTIHSLRHSFETICVDFRIPQLMIDSWPGHQGDRSMASVYYGLAGKESQKFINDVPLGTG